MRQLSSNQSCAAFAVLLTWASALGAAEDPLALASPSLLRVEVQLAGGQEGSYFLRLLGERWSSIAEVVLRRGEASISVPAESIRLVNSEQLEVIADLGMSEAEWEVEVVDAAGNRSSRTTFRTVPPSRQASLPPPLVFRLDPNKVYASRGKRMFRVLGQGFVPLTEVVLTHEAGEVLSVPWRSMRFEGPRELLVSADAARRIGRWTAVVTNPDGQASLPVTLDVVAAREGSPMINRVSPSPAPAAFGDQTVTLYGQGFTEGAEVVFRSGNTTVRVPRGRVRVLGPDEIEVDVDLTAVPTVWSIEVIGKSGWRSNRIELVTRVEH